MTHISELYHHMNLDYLKKFWIVACIERLYEHDTP